MWSPERGFVYLGVKEIKVMDIEIRADRWEEEQELLDLIYTEMVENGEEFRIFNEEIEDELPF